MSDELTGALWILAWGALDTALTYDLAAGDRFGAAAIVAVLSIVTLLAFARAAAKELASCSPMSSLLRY